MLLVWFIHIVAHINLVLVNLVVQLVGSLLVTRSQVTG